jgi:hypothetical protein
MKACGEALQSGDHKEAALSFLQHDALTIFLHSRGSVKVERQFVADSRRMAKDTSDFPTDVSYPEHCIGLCRTVTHPEVLQLSDNVQDAFDDIAKGFAGKDGIPLSYCLLAVEVCTPSGQSCFQFWWMVVGSGQSGRNAATQTFFRLSHLGGPSFTLQIWSDGACKFCWTKRSRKPFGCHHRSTMCSSHCPSTMKHPWQVRLQRATGYQADLR